jgi:hypothetical protein
VPKRTNLFQDVVSVIYEHLAGKAVKEESAMLVNRLTGEEREVDVVLRTTTAGHETVIAIEAAGRTRRAAVDWVEQMIGKHKNLPTDKVVLVSEAGFTHQAETLAAAENMVTLTPTELAGDDPAYRIVNAVPSLWPKTISLTPESAPRCGSSAPAKASSGLGRPPISMSSVATGRRRQRCCRSTPICSTSNFERVAEQIGLADIAEDMERFFTLTVGPGWEVRIDDRPQRLYARWDDRPDGPELHAIDALEFIGKAFIRVGEIKLTHKQLGAIDVNYAYGEGTFDGKPRSSW